MKKEKEVLYWARALFLVLEEGEKDEEKVIKNLILALGKKNYLIPAIIKKYKRIKQKEGKVDVFIAEEISEELKAKINRKVEELEGKNKIIEYYNNQCPFIQKEALTYASQHDFDKAISTLSAVPKVCHDCFMSSMDMITSIYEDKINHECEKIMSLARTYQSLGKYEDAAFTLATILPGSKCYELAGSMISEIENLRYKEILGKARGAWAARNIEETAYYLSQIPEGTPYSQMAMAIAGEIGRAHV